MFERLAKAFPDYDLATLPSIPETWRDESWKNDCCPKFMAPNGLDVYIDYLNQSDRDIPELAHKRFSVIDFSTDGEGDAITVLYTDDWQDVLNFVENYA